MAQPSGQYIQYFGVYVRLAIQNRVGLLGNVAPEFSADVIDALNSYIGKYAKERDSATALRMFNEKIDQVFDSVVV